MRRSSERVRDALSATAAGEHCHEAPIRNLVLCCCRSDCTIIDDSSATLVGTPALHAMIGNASEADPIIRARNLRVLRVCLKRGLSTETRLDGLTAVHHAVLTGLSEVVSMLVEAGADLSAPVIRPGELWNGVDAAELARTLSDLDDTYPERVHELLSDG